MDDAGAMETEAYAMVLANSPDNGIINYNSS